MTAPGSLDTRERILEGALAALARHGVAKLGMTDVSASAGVSRGTLYRYFPTRARLLAGLVQHEMRRFRASMLAATRRADGDAERIHVMLKQTTRYVREHAALQGMLRSDPAFLLESLRAQLPIIRRELHELFAPLLRETEAVRSGALGVDGLVDWITRILISTLLFEDPEPDETAGGIATIYRILQVATCRAVP
ncbi:MAG: TetR/AcrR family transcriptional regulator [Deltaproteobacteria bacterium]|nr:MAG: TetR/AcrR family transcriptional regulator [Deltaproteobacteria bacterium]